MEQIICQTPSLQQLDDSLNKAYRDQTDLEERSFCTDEKCLKRQYLTRINTLVAPKEFYFFETASTHFNAALTIQCLDANRGNCEGPATILIYPKTKNKPFQIINTEYLSIYSFDDPPKDDAIERHQKNLGTIFASDFNFDGKEDLAISNGNTRPYGGRSFDIYLFSPSKNQFIKNEILTELNDSSFDFAVDKKKKQLEIMNKSGCCWHQYSTYKVINNQPKLIQEVTEGLTTDGLYLETTVRKLVKGKWRTKTTKEKVPEDY